MAVESFGDRITQRVVDPKFVLLIPQNETKTQFEPATALMLMGALIVLPLQYGVPAPGQRMGLCRVHAMVAST
jgi:hypothetical protein